MAEKNLVGDYLVYVRPEITPTDTAKFEQTLVNKFTKVGNDIGSRVVEGIGGKLRESVLRGGAILAGAVGVSDLLGRLFDTKFKEGQEAYDEILNNAKDIQDIAGQTGASVRQVAKAKELAASGQIPEGQFLEDILRIQELQAEGNPLLKNFKNTNQIQNFFDIIKSLSAIPKAQQGLLAEKIFGRFGAIGALRLANKTGGIDAEIEELNKSPDYREYGKNFDKTDKLTSYSFADAARTKNIEVQRGVNQIANMKDPKKIIDDKRELELAADERNRQFINNLNALFPAQLFNIKSGKAFDNLIAGVQGATASVLNLSDRMDKAAVNAGRLAEQAQKVSNLMKQGKTLEAIKQGAILENQSFLNDQFFGYVYDGTGTKRIKKN